MTLRSVLPQGGTLPYAVWRSRHRGILFVLWAHVPALFVFALVRGYGWNHSLVEASLVAIPAFIAVLAVQRRMLSTVCTSVGLMTASAVLVHISGGVTEAHFHFFIMVGVVVLYQEWTPFLIAISFVVLHHSVMGSIYPHDVYGNPSAWKNPITWAAIHGAAILGMSAAGIANWRINEKHQAQLTEVNAMLEATLESTIDGILVVDLDGLITKTNVRFSELYALPASILAVGDDKAIIAHVRDQVQDPEGFVTRTDWLYAHPEAESNDTLMFNDGRVIERSSKPQRVAGQIVGRVWTFHDVTGRKRLENELAEALGKAIESSRLKSEFLATMSHEIRTPMNGIIGLTSLLLDSDLPGTEREYVEGVNASGEALLRIVNDILDFSKIEAGKIELEAVDFNVGSAIDEVVSLVAQQASAKGISLTAEPAGNEPVRLRGDVGRLRQILLNLVSNAVKFTAAGHVTVRYSTTSAGDAVALHVDVEDTGIGIAEEDRERLFEPFTQVDASTTRRFGGTGLGLAISSRLVTEMGGTIGVTSAVGHGSVFSFDVPFPLAEARADEVSVAEPETPSSNADHSSDCLLIVEDNVVNQLVMKEMVKHLGYGFDIAADGHEALAALERRAYSAVVMDCYMPEMDGFTATAELRRREGHAKHTPVIALTAGATQEDRENCIAAGMDDYLTKPVSRAQLASVLHRWVGSAA